MERRINNIAVKVSGRVESGKKFHLGEDVTLVINGTVVQEIIGDEQDGSVNITYTIKPVSLENDDAN